MRKKVVSVWMAAMMATGLVTACGWEAAPAAAPTGMAAPAAVEAAPAAEEEPAAEEAPADGGLVSDEMFARLQENYGLLVQAYDAVVDVYNDDAVAANPDIENAMNRAKDIIEQMGGITQEELTVADAEDLLDAIIDIAEAFDLVLDGMELTSADAL